MRAFVASDNAEVTSRIRQVLSRLLVTCGTADAAPTPAATEHLRHDGADVVIVVLPSSLPPPGAGNPEGRLRALAQIRVATQAKVFVVGPADDSRLILAALHEGGADQYIDLAHLETQLEEVIGRLQPARPGKVLAVLSAGGGCGGSTVAVNLAARLARDHQRCALLDLHPVFGDAAALLDLEPTHSILDFAHNASRMDRALFEQLLVQHASGIGLLAAPSRFADPAGITTDVLAAAVRTAQRLYPFVVLDLDQSGGPDLAETWRLAQVLLLVFRLDFASLHKVHRWLLFLRGQGLAEPAIRLVCNGYGRPRQLKVSQAEDVLGAKITDYLPDDPRHVLEANNLGMPVVLKSPSAKFSRRLGDLVKGLNGFCRTT